MVSACVSLEPYALRVLDDSMAPDFPAGAVVIVDPGEPVEDGCFVVLEHGGEVLLRRLRSSPPREGGGRPRLVAPSRPDVVLAPDGDWRRCVRGVVTGVRIPRDRAAGSSSSRGPGEAPAAPPSAR